MSGSERLNRKAISKNANLDALEREARKSLPVDFWNTKEGLNAMRDMGMLRWNLSEPTARSYARIVQLRLTASKQPRQPTEAKEIDPLTPEQEENLSVNEIISTYRKAQPAIKPTDFPVIEEEEKNND